MQVVTDHYMAELSRAELAVLHYIIRRTAGFGKERDAIGYPQFMEGITKQDGTVLDRGTGIKDRNTLARALASLEARGLIAQHAHRGVSGGGSQYADYRVLIDTDESRDSSATKVGKIPTVVPGDESMDYPATKVGKSLRLQRVAPKVAVLQHPALPTVLAMGLQEGHVLERKNSRPPLTPCNRGATYVIRVSRPHCAASNGSGTRQALLRRQAGTDPGKRRARWPLLSLRWRDQVSRLSLQKHCHWNPHPDDMEHDRY
jgi:hypothetical protein